MLSVLCIDMLIVARIPIMKAIDHQKINGLILPLAFFFFNCTYRKGVKEETGLK